MTDMGATVIGGGARHVAIVSRAVVGIGTENAKRYIFIELFRRRRRVLCVLAF
jgi:hypothetical protein